MILGDGKNNRSAAMRTGLGTRTAPLTNTMVGGRTAASPDLVVHRMAQMIQGREALVVEGQAVEEEVLGGALPQCLPRHHLAQIPRREAAEEVMVARMVVRMVAHMAVREAVLEGPAVSPGEHVLRQTDSSELIQHSWPFWNALRKSKRGTNGTLITGRLRTARRGFGFVETSLRLVRKTATSCCWSSTSSKRCLRGPILVTRKIGP